MKKRNKKYLVVLVVVVVIAGLSFFFLNSRSGEPEYSISTVPVERGSVNNVITATGTLEATNTVVVGTQVSGVIEKLYVDFNSRVEKGQLIAELDKSTLLSSLQTAQADLERAQANMEYQKSNLDRNKGLYEKGLLAKSDYDLVVFNHKTSCAEVKSAEANLSRAERNVSYASIYSPIDGLVLNRAVEEGQTVAASMNTPELFTITNDLSTMQVEANVDEADIGMLKLGQRVEFTVDAFSELTFEGEVSEIRLQPNESANVITYTTIITVENPEFKLKPGMTASITVYVEEANDVLLLAEKATRFTPDMQLLHGYMSQLKGEEEQTAENGERPSPPRKGMNQEEDGKTVVWVKSGDDIRPVAIETGIDNGSDMEVLSGLEEGDLVVTSLTLSDGSKSLKKSKDDDQKSPFIQERPGGGKSGGGPGGPPPM